MSNKSEKRDAFSHWWLRTADQLVVAVLVAAGLASTVGWWMWQGGLRGRLIEVEQAGPLSAQFQVDVNEAEWPELIQIPGIGPNLARRIVDSRQTVGPFVDHDDLLRIRGIGPKTLDTMRPYLRPMPGGGQITRGRNNAAAENDAQTDG